MVDLNKIIYVTPIGPSERNFKKFVDSLAPPLEKTSHLRAIEMFNKARHSVRDAALNSLGNHFFQKYIVKDKHHKITLIALLSKPSFLEKIRHEVRGIF